MAGTFENDTIFQISESDKLKSLESCIAHFLASNEPLLWEIENAFIETPKKDPAENSEATSFLQAIESEQVE